MSSNQFQSVKYDPSSSSPRYSTLIDKPEDALPYLMAGMVPQNLYNMSTQTIAFRDYTMASIMLCSDPDSILLTLMRDIQSTPSIDTPDSVVMCEYAASIAYAQGHMDLAKEILIRINPVYATSLTKLLYKSISNGFISSMFKSENTPLVSVIIL